MAAGGEGGLHARAVAAARVEQILAGHGAPPLPAGVQAALDDIVARAEARVRPA